MGMGLGTWLSWQLLPYPQYVWVWIHGCHNLSQTFSLWLGTAPCQLSALYPGISAAAGKLSPTNDDVIKWKFFPHYWPFVCGNSPVTPVNSPHKGQWRKALTFSLISSTWTNSWTNNEDTGDLKCHCAHYDVIVMTHVHACTQTQPILWESSYKVSSL